MNALDLINAIAESAGISLDGSIEIDDEHTLERYEVKIGTGNFNPNAWSISRVTSEYDAFASVDIDDENLHEYAIPKVIWLACPDQHDDSPYAPRWVM